MLQESVGQQLIGGWLGQWLGQEGVIRICQSLFRRWPGTGQIQGRSHCHCQQLSHYTASPQKLEVGPHGGPYLLVHIKKSFCLFILWLNQIIFKISVAIVSTRNTKINWCIEPLISFNIYKVLSLCYIVHVMTGSTILTVWAWQHCTAKGGRGQNHWMNWINEWQRCL